MGVRPDAPSLRRCRAVTAIDSPFSRVLGHRISRVATAVPGRGPWQYATGMPRLPILATGVAPLVQWIVLPPRTVSFVARQLRGEQAIGDARITGT